MSENTIDARYFQDGGNVMGPIMAATDGQRSFLAAYEHGSQVPDAFLRFQLSPDRSIRLTAVKGNYVPGQVLDAEHPFTSIWMDTASTAGGIDALASAWRRFVLKSMAQNLATRKPYIFYNTWNFQERNKWWNGKPYLESMTQERILKEIDVAHRMGIDVLCWTQAGTRKPATGRSAARAFPTG